MAIAVNVIAINPQGGGNLKGWAGDIAEPLRAAVVNYQALNPNLNIANATILAIRITGSLGVGEDIVLRANGAGTHRGRGCHRLFRACSDGRPLHGQGQPTHSVCIRAAFDPRGGQWAHRQQRVVRELQSYGHSAALA